MHTYAWIRVNLPEIHCQYKSVTKAVEVQDDGHSLTSKTPVVPYNDGRIV
jgi:hypothetical protein